MEAIGRDILEPRELAGLSRHAVSAATSVSESAIRRLELGRLRGMSLERLALVADAVGLEPSLRLYPTGAPLRDRAHIELLERLRTQLHPMLRWRTEVPLPRDGDLRAWDAVIARGGDWLPVEAETRLGDLQALERRINLKLRDARADRIILLAKESRINRSVLAAAPEAWNSTFSVRTRAALRDLRNGRLPLASALIVL